MTVLVGVLVLLAVAGCIQAVAGFGAVRAFAARRTDAPGERPPVSILKPVCGDEPLLEDALASFCAQRYPGVQMVIGAHDAADPALAVARRVQARFPDGDIAIVADATPHGANRKVANLINMLPAARHDLLVIADSDLHVRPDYLEQVVAALQQPGVGLVTTVNVAEPAVPGSAAQLGAAHLTHIFLPGALLAFALGRQDNLGCTTALRRHTLAQAGGFAALADELADDNVLGQRVRRLGLTVRLAGTVPVVTVQDRSLRLLWQHELRWGRTIRALAPVAFATTALQYPLFWALLAVLLSNGADWTLAGFAAAWAVRAAAAHGVDRTLRDRIARPLRPVPLWLLPLRDTLSMAQLVASYLSGEVVWRGQRLSATRPVRRASSAAPATDSPLPG